MKLVLKTSLIMATLITMRSAGLYAQTVAESKKTTVSIETDPSTFLFNGYAVHVRIKPKSSEHIVIGAGLYALDLPNIMVDLNKDNKSKGWKVRINSAYSFFGEYYFTKANRGWLTGIQAGIQNYKNSNDKLPGLQSNYSNLLLMPSLGYNWHPFKYPVYLKPWLGLGYTTKLSGNNSINNTSYQIAALVPFIAVHIGYSF